VLNWIEVDRRRILENYDRFQKMGDNCQIWPVIKANAYGHGLEQIVEILKVRSFEYLVADSYFEALKVQNICNKKVLLIGSNHPENYKKMKMDKLTIGVQDWQSLKALAALTRKVRIQIKVNSGMNRQGFELGELKEVAKRIRMAGNLECEGIFSHLAEAENRQVTMKQEKSFVEAIGILEGQGLRLKWKHLAATGGAGVINNKRFNAIRLGLGLYQESLRLWSTIVKIREVKKGEKIGYEGAYRAPRNIKIALLPIGYHEGVRRALSNKGMVGYKGNLVPIRGLVCMNMMMVEIGKGRLFEKVEVISPRSYKGNSIKAMARICETNEYEIMTGLDGSMRRLIV
jgi:alanine racemase